MHLGAYANRAPRNVPFVIIPTSSFFSGQTTYVGAPTAAGLGRRSAAGPGGHAVRGRNLVVAGEDQLLTPLIYWILFIMVSFDFAGTL